MTGTTRGTILVVDDDENVRLLAQWLLGRLGYATVGAETAAVALELSRQALARGERFAAVILDLCIPGSMAGAEALAALRELDPEVPAFVMSGDIDDPRMRNFAAYGFQGAISKTLLQETLPTALKKHFGFD